MLLLCPGALLLLCLSVPVAILPCHLCYSPALSPLQGDTLRISTCLDKLGVATGRPDIQLRSQMAYGMFDTRGRYAAGCYSHVYACMAMFPRHDHVSSEHSMADHVVSESIAGARKSATDFIEVLLVLCIVTASNARHPSSGLPATKASHDQCNLSRGTSRQAT